MNTEEAIATNDFLNKLMKFIISRDMMINPLFSNMIIGTQYHTILYTLLRDGISKNTFSYHVLFAYQ